MIEVPILTVSADLSKIDINFIAGSYGTLIVNLEIIFSHMRANLVGSDNIVNLDKVD